MNSTANDPQKLSRKELSESIDLRGLEKRLDIRQQEEDVEGIRRMGRLAVKYMGKQNGFQVQINRFRIKIVSSYFRRCFGGVGVGDKSNFLISIIFLQVSISITLPISP